MKEQLNTLFSDFSSGLMIKLRYTVVVHRECSTRVLDVFLCRHVLFFHFTPLLRFFLFARSVVIIISGSTLTKESKVLSLQDIIIDIVTSPCPLLNYLILMVSYIFGIAGESIYTRILKVSNKKLKLTIRQKSTLLQKITI